MLIPAGRAEALISVSDLTAGYNGRPVLDGINFEVCAGEMVGVCGPNGSGKTTFLHCITGHHRPWGGVVKLNGEMVGSMDRREVARHVAYVPQRAEPAFAFSVFEMVLMGRHPYAGFALLDSVNDRQVAMDALRLLQIEGLAHRRFNHLSGGEQQLVLLARAFAQQTAMLVLDEPLTGLDIRHQFQLMDALRRETEGGDRAAVTTFHDLSMAARWCTRLILLRQGVVIADGRPCEVLTDSNLERVYGVRVKIGVGADGEVTAIEVQSLVNNAIS